VENCTFLNIAPAFYVPVRGSLLRILL